MSTLQFINSLICAHFICVLIILVLSEQHGYQLEYEEKIIVYLFAPELLVLGVIYMVCKRLRGDK